MAKNLLIVESPAKSRTLTKYLGKDFKVISSMGHIIDLPTKELGIDIENDFAPKYIPIKGKGKVIKEIKSAAKGKECIYLAPDPDREGEAIAWHIQNLVGDKVPIKRVLFHEITKNGVKKGISEPGEINLKRVNAQQARRFLDRIVGYLVSPVLWKVLYRGLSAGRVQSVALRLICERNDEIKAFKADEYWTVDANLKTQNKNIFLTRLSKKDAKTPELDNKSKVDKIINSIKNEDFIVSDVKKREKKRSPYPPFITSTLQQASSRQLNYSAKKTMMAAQQLYEGLEIGDETIGLITYMRTDSTRISDDAKALAIDYIKQTHGESFIPKKQRVFKKTKGTQDAHEAIRPANISPEFAPNKIKKYLSQEQYKLYDLIWRRFIASQMTEALYNSTTIIIKAGSCDFRTTGQIEIFPGFKKEYIEVKEDNEADSENKDLPEINKGDKLEFVEWLPKQHFTQPPPAYSEALLIKELEAQGIGRPSTYAQIIDTLKRRNYVIFENKRFAPSEIGNTVNTILIKSFQDFFNVNFTANMENNLDKIESGEMDWVNVLKDFYGSFSKTLDSVTKDIPELKKFITKDIGEKCDKCGSPMLIKWGINGKFKACSAYPKCTNTKPLEEEKIDLKGEKCPECGKPLVVKHSRGGPFIGCSGYPECRFTKSISIGIKCPMPDCKGEVVQRKSKRGRVFFGCSEYPKCSFVSWDKPIITKCPECGNPFMVEKSNKTIGQYLYCTKCKAKISKEDNSVIS